MTNAVAVQTSTAIVLAADSRLTTYGRVGYDTKGEAIVVPQTYENATKIVQDAAETAMVAVTGSATLGGISFMDYFASSAFPTDSEPAKHEESIKGFAEGMAKLRTAYWSDVPLERWPDTVLLLGCAVPYSHSPMLWRIAFAGEQTSVDSISNPVYFEGSYRSVFTLLYGYDSQFLSALMNEVKVGDQPPDAAAIRAALGAVKVLKPIEQLSVAVMPIQDAMDFAFFLASTQVQMERFLPGEPYCGGPIDIMVLKTTPNREILWHPGKVLRHPGSR